VVIIGGGFGGATAAKYLRLADPSLEITLVERDTYYVTCPFSNQVLAGLKEFMTLSQSYRKLAFNYNIQLAHTTAINIDPEARLVSLSSNDKLNYDRLIISPGIDFRWDTIEGYGPDQAHILPHAWLAGPQTLTLRRQLKAMPDGGRVIIAPPDGHYRGLTAPYERASLIAYYLKHEKPRSKVIILDAKNEFPQREQFLQAWNRLYPGMIEWVPAAKGGKVSGIQDGKITTNMASFKADVANIIPPQQAGAIARLADLTDDSGWCPVDPRTFESLRQPGIHIIGDSCIAGDMPKTASAANSQAKVCAAAVVALLAGDKPDEPALINAVYHVLGPDYAISEADFYHVAGEHITYKKGGGGITPLQASDQQHAMEASYAMGWYRNIIADTFS
jgi:sulfide dehydrogenase [flavocytochrome c] flavoprotein subunit